MTALVRAILEQASSQLNIDLERVYATGYAVPAPRVRSIFCYL
jgi:hypothetical protein